MKFNYQAEKMKFDAKWKELQVRYESAGMSKEAIKEMKQYDWDEFKRERIFCIHNQQLEGYVLEDGGYSDLEQRNPFMQRHKEAFIKEDVYFDEKANGWIEELDTEELIRAIKKLDQDKLDLITKLVYEQKTMEEIAKEIGITKSAVSQRLSTIKKYIKNFKRT